MACRYSVACRYEVSGFRAVGTGTGADAMRSNDVAPRARPWRERGSVTAEAAVALPALLLVLATALWAVTIVGAQLRCVDAARAGARAAARGEATEEVRAVVLRLAPEGAAVSVRPGADTTRVEVIVTVRPPFRSPLPPVRLRAVAVSDTEPGVIPAMTVTIGENRTIRGNRP